MAGVATGTNRWDENLAAGWSATGAVAGLVIVFRGVDNTRGCWNVIEDERIGHVIERQCNDSTAANTVPINTVDAGSDTSGC